MTKTSSSTYPAAYDQNDDAHRRHRQHASAPQAAGPASSDPIRWPAPPPPLPPGPPRIVRNSSLLSARKPSYNLFEGRSSSSTRFARSNYGNGYGHRGQQQQQQQWYRPTNTNTNTNTTEHNHMNTNNMVPSTPERKTYRDPHSNGTKYHRPPFSPAGTRNMTMTMTTASPTSTTSMNFSPGININKHCHPCSPGSATRSVIHVKPPVTPKQRLKNKTELCTLFMKHGRCSFGATCHFAHGVEELRSVGLLELAKGGLIDLKRYRQRPCPTFVATGACPFDTRCEHLHDKRLFKSEGSTDRAWMPYKDKLDPSKSSRLSTLYVNIAHSEQMEELHNQADYALAVRDQIIQAMNTFNGFLTRGKLAAGAVTEAQCIHILLQMRSKIEQDFVYKPTHYVLGESCMLLQRRAFRCMENSDAVVEEVKLNNDAHHQCVDTAGGGKVLWVTELAFGSSHCARSREQSIFFNLSKREILSCTDYYHQPFQASSPSRSRSNLDCLISLPVWRYLNSDIHTLATEVLQSRLEKHLDPPPRNTDTMNVCDDLQMHNEKWSWPITSERKDERITRRTLDPDVTTLYTFFETDAGSLSSARVWNSFLGTMGDSADPSSDDKVHSPPRRMACFPRLVSGNDDEVLENGPYLVSSKQPDDQGFTVVNAQKKMSRSERCWRSILTFDGPEDWSNLEEEF